MVQKHSSCKHIRRDGSERSRLWESSYIRCIFEGVGAGEKGRKRMHHWVNMDGGYLYAAVLLHRFSRRT